MAESTEVVVIGGGYAGVMAANRLTRRDDVYVTLINPRSTFVQRIRLHHLVAGSGDPLVEYEQTLSPAVRLVVDAATRIDAAERSVSLASGGAVRYDYLVYAVGSGSAEPSAPGAAEFAYTMDTLEAAQRLRSVLDDTPLSAPVTVVGSGPTGNEVAAELADAGRPVTLLAGTRFAPYLHPKARQTVRKRMARLGVTVLEGTATAVTRDAVRLGDGKEVPSAVTVWTAGFGVPDLAVRSGLRTDDKGRLITDETLTSVDDERIVAAGDSVSPSGVPLRMSCQGAIPLGAHAADTVLARLSGDRPAPIDIGLPAVCTSLGSGNATMQFLAKNGEARRLFVSGRLGSKLKEFTYPHVIGMLAKEAREPGTFVWKPKDERRSSLLAERGAARAVDRAA
ncbi:FAD-dependent oxidoreductase [Glycomyces sp. TRM65418]|uniref:NAD(P)/FAD-dependent oxidoreductase n=1 Tax=Glycomyces sp. TRM65418 TaxID=2867006 RepID=UPI001CE4C0B8|nr:FAD-dependent oxidoreductase [Glycomyces sp. TRM65418]MCC3765410.1 FAD-dependent oxidoreductase [Glycomyces sp. TRM65418]QZD55021.1 FAD-dependent oxidoreductase [Glycomyces sp. TRM65418]